MPYVVSFWVDHDPCLRSARLHLKWLAQIRDMVSADLRQVAILRLLGCNVHESVQEEDAEN
jgi:hypothetical protein